MILRPPPAVLEIAETLERAGHETWCVGGAVRDALLGLPDLDWDLATAATPQRVRELFGQRRTIPVGIEHGTVGVLDRAGRLHEVTTFRRDVKTDGRHAEVEFGVSLDDDLARRDFTINAIAWSPKEERLHDPFGGREDLARRVVRAVGDPTARMREDRLRALRAIRFASRFGFEIDEETWAAVLESAPHLGRLSMERVKQEIGKTLEQVARPSLAFRRWRDSGAFAAVVPALADATDVVFATLDHLPMPGLARRPQRLPNRLAALVLDLGGSGAEKALRGLKASNHEVTWSRDMAERWAALGPAMRLALLGGAPDDLALRRWAARAGRTRLAPLLRIAAARWDAEREAGNVAPAADVVRSAYRRGVRIAYRDPIELGDLAVDGDDLRRAGFAAGPALGKLLHALRDHCIEDPTVNEPGRLLALAREITDGGRA